MNQKNKTYLAICILISAICLINLSCYQKTEGCTDPNSLKYDVSADEMCSNNCCTYPIVFFSIDLTNDTTDVDTLSVFKDDYNNSIRIKSLRMFLSDFQFASASDTIDVINHVILGDSIDGVMKYTSKNCSAIKYALGSTSFTSGTTALLKEFTNLRFLFGLNTDINHSGIAKLSTSNPLYQLQDSMHINVDKGYYFLKMTIELKDNGNLRNIEMFGDENSANISVNGTINLTVRANHTVKLKLDSKKWFAGINFISDSDMEIYKKLSKNISSSFSI